MFNYRAAAFWTRLYAPELSLGMHTVDENEDIATVVTHIPPANRATRPRGLQAIVDGSNALDAAFAEDAPPAATGEAVAPSQEPI